MASKKKKSKTVTKSAPKAAAMEASAEPSTAATATAAAPLSKSAFIRSVPREMPAKEVVEKAKAVGIELSANHVSAVRSTMKAGGKKRTGTKRAAKTSARGKATSSSTAKAAAAKGLSKTAFVLSLPIDLPASDVVKQAKAAGIKVTTQYVYVIRSNAKGRSVRKQGRPKGSSTKIMATTSGDDSMASAFRKLVVALGVTRSRNLVDEVEGKIEALFG